MKAARNKLNKVIKANNEEIESLDDAIKLMKKRQRQNKKHRKFLKSQTDTLIKENHQLGLLLNNL